MKSRLQKNMWKHEIEEIIKLYLTGAMLEEWFQATSSNDSGVRLVDVRGWEDPRGSRLSIDATPPISIDTLCDQKVATLVHGEVILGHKDAQRRFNVYLANKIGRKLAAYSVQFSIEPFLVQLVEHSDLITRPERQIVLLPKIVKESNNLNLLVFHLHVMNKVGGKLPLLAIASAVPPFMVDLIQEKNLVPNLEAEVTLVLPDKSIQGLKQFRLLLLNWGRCAGDKVGWELAFPIAHSAIQPVLIELIEQKDFIPYPQLQVTFLLCSEIIEGSKPFVSDGGEAGGDQVGLGGDCCCLQHPGGARNVADGFGGRGIISFTLKRDHDGEFPEIEEALFRWIRQANAMKLAINGNILKEKAILLALKMGQDNFEASNGWLEKFKARRNIAFKPLHGEAGSVDANSVATWKGGIIPLLLAKYSPQDIFNADETRLFYKLLPNQTMTIRGEKCEGGKKSKERITVLVCCNMNGSEKLPLLYIGKYRRPRCFHGMNIPSNYYFNKKAWMTGAIFTDWLKKLDQIFKRRERIF
ncbi:hypothetical protein LAZ67_3005994 [Cordylochernes scorpioides]|uniref:HTH CENPB-type domain-containing protein n=1 Tax=Cordylochernes scorpioides TaxID=51811 RepID=A0ABY6KDT8_9ARAC|nr:hypothetical protein LAZ67_3005994 [Cordylochernes scorpioides]